MKGLWIKVSGVVLFLFSSLYCQLALADLPFVSLFNIQPNDISRNFLSQIFGQVGMVLTGKEVPLSRMFADFNRAVLVLGALVIIYTTLVAIINTAHQGEFLGKKMDSLWVPIRSVTGFALLVPGATGYSTIQIFMMWIVLQGIGAADSLWKVTVNSFQNLGVEGVASGLSEDVTAMGNILAGLTCMHGVYKNEHPGATYDTDSLKPYLNTNSVYINVRGYNHVTGTQYVFGDQNSQQNFNPYYKCGSLIYASGFNEDTKLAGEGSATAYAFGVIPITKKTVSGQEKDDPFWIAQFNALGNTLPTIVKETLNDVAKKIVYIPDQVKHSINPIIEQTQIVRDAVEEQVENTTSNKPEDAWIAATIGKGWMTAGRYYYDVAQTGGGKGQYYAYAGSTQFSPKEASVAGGGVLQQIIEDASKQIGTGPAPQAPPSRTEISVAGISVGSSAMASTIKSGMNQVKNSLYYLESFGAGHTTSLKEDPIMVVHDAGVQIQAIIYSVFAAILVLTGIIAATAGLCASTSSGFLVITGLWKFMSLPILTLMGTLYVASLTMSVYIPMVPFIIFSFAAIGWMIAVVETMIAAPLVALGITHPEGHEIYGRAEPAIQLLTNVFLRPSLMIFGLICGMLTARVSVNFINMFFGSVVVSKLGMNGGIPYIMAIVIYVSMLIAIINRCFSLIHMIPDRVLAWIGNQQQFGQYSQGMEDTVKGGFQQGAQTTAKAGEQAGQSGIEGATAAGGQKNKEEMEAKQQAKGARVDKSN